MRFVIHNLSECHLHVCYAGICFTAKKKAATEAKKVIAVANRATNKAAKATKEAAAKKKNNRKGKKAGHLQDIENLEDAIQQLFLEPNNEIRTIKEEDVIEQLNAKLQAATNEASPRNNHRPQRIRVPPKRYL
jgi:hypothetical protein